jgi:anti-sigma factor RsiW
MKCNKVLSRLHAYVDGEVEAKLVCRMEEHIGACPSCRGQIERIRRVGGMLDGLTVPLLPPEFSTRVMAEAQRRASLAGERRAFFPSGRETLRWLRDLSVPMRVAACAMVLMASVLGMFMSKELSVSGNRPIPVVEAENLDGLEWFSTTPPVSLGSAYLTLALTAPDEHDAR